MYEVTDPEHVRERVGLISKKPVMMMVEATKIREAQMFAIAPLQSDYVAMWDSPDGDSAQPSFKSSLKGLVKRSAHELPLSMRAPVHGYLEKRRFSLGTGVLRAPPMALTGPYWFAADSLDFTAVSCFWYPRGHR